MGYWIDLSLKGLYLVNVTGSEPYCVGWIWIECNDLITDGVNFFVEIKLLGEWSRKFC